VDGLYNAPPARNATAKLIPVVERITPEIEEMAGAAPSELSRGGMQTKIEAAKIATTGGTHMVIGSGLLDHPLRAIASAARSTWFLTPGNPVTSRKKWIAGSLEPKGTLVIDAGAVAALRRGNSLLPVGVIRVEGQFARGDAVIVRGPDAPGWRYSRRGTVRPGRRRHRTRSGRRRDRPRSRRLRRPGCPQGQGPALQ
jgi:glutamate 5-kinase